MNWKDPWLLIGFFGQLLFTARFFAQWIASEKRGESTVPNLFWYLSVAGGLVMLAYAIHRRDPVFTLGQAGALGIYARNIYLLRRSRLRSLTGSPIV